MEKSAPDINHIKHVWFILDSNKEHNQQAFFKNIISTKNKDNICSCKIVKNSVNRYIPGKRIVHLLLSCCVEDELWPAEWYVRNLKDGCRYWKQCVIESDKNLTNVMCK